MPPGQIDVRVKVLDIVVCQLLGTNKLSNCLPLLVHGVEMVYIKVEIIIRGKRRAVIAMIPQGKITTF